MSSPSPVADKTARQHWMAVLARADHADLERAWRTLNPSPKHTWLRNPETGLIMLRGRAGGTGAQFNLGEASVTRCTVRVSTAGGADLLGYACVLGRDHRLASLAALFDALLQDPSHSPGLQQTLIRKLAATQAGRRREKSLKAAATRVDFYTMVRGESPS